MSGSTRATSKFWSGAASCASAVCRAALAIFRFLVSSCENACDSCSCSLECDRRNARILSSVTSLNRRFRARRPPASASPFSSTAHRSSVEVSVDATSPRRSAMAGCPPAMSCSVSSTSCIGVLRFCSTRVVWAAHIDRSAPGGCSPAFAFRFAATSACLTSSTVAAPSAPVTSVSQSRAACAPSSVVKVTKAHERFFASFFRTETPATTP